MFKQPAATDSFGRAWYECDRCAGPTRNEDFCNICKTCIAIAMKMMQRPQIVHDDEEGNFGWGW